MSTSSNHQIPSALEAQPPASFHSRLNDDDFWEKMKLLQEIVSTPSKAFEELRAACIMCLEKMDKILAIIEASKKDREERERRRKAWEQENFQIRKNIRRQTSRRVRQTR
jgi:hypothetical protein